MPTVSSDDSDTGRLNSEADEPGWEVDPDDDWGVAVIATVGRQLRLRREAKGMRAAEFGEAVGYGECLVYKVEGGKRIPRAEYLDRADEVLKADGLLSAMSACRGATSRPRPGSPPVAFRRFAKGVGAGAEGRRGTAEAGR